MNSSQLLHEFKIYLLLERKISLNTSKAYLTDVQQYFEFCLKQGLHNPEFTNKEVESFLGALNDLNLKSASIQRKLSAIKACRKFMAFNDQKITVPALDISVGQKGLRLPKFLNESDMHAIFDACKNEEECCILELLYGCGMRVSELVELKTSQIMHDSNLLKVTGKGNKQRIIPIHESGMKAIEAYQKNLRNQIEPTKGQEAYFLLTQKGKKWSRQKINVLLHDIALKSGLNKNLHPHLFRHTFATHLLNRGADLRSIQNLLGHESVTTTEIYSHLNISKLNKLVDQFHPRATKPKVNQKGKSLPTD